MAVCLVLCSYAYPYSFDQYAGYYGVPVIYLLAQYNMYMCKLGYKTDYSTYFMITVKGRAPTPRSKRLNKRPLTRVGCLCQARTTCTPRATTRWRSCSRTAM